MNTRQNPIPRLDLAPKLNRPLSLFNPLDYLRLLYWVFFFPQAIRWYVATFKQEKTLRIQGLLLTVLTPILICFILQEFSFSVNWWGVAWGVTIWRPEVWVIGSLLNLGSLQNSSWLFPRITPIPLPFLSSRLTSWLEQDWQLGLENANQLLRYSLQFIPVVKGVNQVLEKTPPEHLIFKISQLAEHPYDWLLVKFASASLGEEFKLEIINIFRDWDSQLVVQPRLDTPAHAAAAGFWYLHEKQPEKATEAFGVVSSLLYGQEMLTLAQILTLLTEHQTIDAIATLELPDFPPEPYLRSQSWTAIKTLYQVVEDVNLIKNSGSISTGSLALNRALGKVKRILDQSETLPEAERDLIIDIAKNWQSALLGCFSSE